MAKTYRFHCHIGCKSQCSQPRQQQISKVLTPHSEFSISAMVVLFDATKHVECSRKPAQHMHAEIEFRKAAFQHCIIPLPGVMVLVQRPVII
jgi:hypothetical protein